MIKKYGWTLTFLCVFIVTVTMAAASDSQSGQVTLDITNAVGIPLPARLVLQPKRGESFTFFTDAGRVHAQVPPGTYQAYTYVYDWDRSFMVDARTITVQAEKTSFIPIELLEGSSKDTPLSKFDSDYDQVLDRVEEECGTDRTDPADYPGAQPVVWQSKDLGGEPGWYCGDLQIRSKYGDGKQSVGHIISEAEKMGLDFIAITDRNTMECLKDPKFKSDKVILIPAMEWGDDEHGVALIYGPRTFPEPVQDVRDGQSVMIRVQAQGGITAVAHPCFPNSPWQRGIGFMNAVEIWCRDWREVPPLSLKNLNEELQRRDKKGRLYYTVAQAAATPGLSANGQAMVYWQHTLRAGFQSSPIAGSGSASKKVPIGHPVTWIYAQKKSTRALLEGLKRGNTFVSRGPEGPRLYFEADVLGNGQKDARAGDIIPVGVKTIFAIRIVGAKGCKVQVMLDGRPAFTKYIETDDFNTGFEQTPMVAGSFCARVVRVPDTKEKGFGDLDVLAVSAPIYVKNLIIMKKGMKPEDMWIRLVNTNTPPVYADKERAPDGSVRVNPNLALPQQDILKNSPPPIKPAWRF